MASCTAGCRIQSESMMTLPLFVLGGVIAYSRKARGGLRLLSTPQAAVPNAAGIRMLDRVAECIALLRRRSPLAPEGSNPSASAYNHLVWHGASSNPWGRHGAGR